LNFSSSTSSLNLVKESALVRATRLELLRRQPGGHGQAGKQSANKIITNTPAHTKHGGQEKVPARECFEKILSAYFAFLFFVGSAFQPSNGEEHGKNHGEAHKRRGAIGKVCYQDGGAAAERSDKVNRQYSAALA
jgi:hypothetical protein